MQRNNNELIELKRMVDKKWVNQHELPPYVLGGATNLDELALKERHLTGQSVRAVTLMVFS